MTTAFSIGQHIGDYEIISILGAGGMGKVYKVRNVISERTEAMKILLPDLTSNQSLADRFLREIRLLATLHHPNIAALRTALTYENQLVMIMEYVEGETIANRLARAPMSTAEVVNYSDQCLTALSYAHKQSIIHRDIKPANMMLTPDGVVKLMDFGIARSSAKDGSLTSTGTTLGSLNYMPPEQVRGENADARSDIYSFGASLYEMLTGKLPFENDSQYALMTAQLNNDPPPPITIRGDLPPALNQIILMCMSKDPDKRFQSADALRAAIKTVPVSDLPPAKTTAVPQAEAQPQAAAPARTPASQPASGSTTLLGTPLPSRAPTIPAPTPTQAAAPPSTVAESAAPPFVVAPPVATPPQSRPSSSSRGLWLAIGSLVGVSVLIAAGVYIPRHMGTHADPAVSTDSPSAPSQPPAASTDSSAPSSPSTPAAAAGSSPSSSPDGPVSIQAPGVGISVDDKGNVAIKSPGASISATADGNVDVKAPHASVSATKDGAASVTGGGASVRVGGRNNASAAATRAASQAALSQQPPPSAPGAVPPPSPSADEIQRLTDDGEKLQVRQDTVNEGLNALKQQQASSGYGLRADMVAAQQRMTLFLNKANNALQKGDTANAQKYFDQADAEISKLEKFLGH
jgi:serine/threonine protein kinase